MKLDRDLQRAILERLRDDYPRADDDLLEHLCEGSDSKLNHVIANLFYLQSHGLVEGTDEGRGLTINNNGDYGFFGLRISARGLDFLEQDGGMSSILGVVTIRFHDDAIKDLIAAQIEATSLPPPDKKRFLDRLRELPAESTKHLVLKLVDLGLEKAPQAIELLGKVLS